MEQRTGYKVLAVVGKAYWNYIHAKWTVEHGVCRNSLFGIIDITIIIRWHWMVASVRGW
jgi:hypothetical protein